MNDPRHSRIKNPGAGVDWRGGFSLMEMLIVLALVGMISSFAVPAFTDMMKGSRVRQAADLIRNQMVIAQQTAIKDGKIVVLQFYRYNDAQSPGDDTEFGAIQLMVRDSILRPSGSRQPTSSSSQGLDDTKQGLPALDRVLPLPDGVILSDDPKYSTLLSRSRNRQFRSSWRRLPRSLSLGTAEVLYFEFRPDGSTSLDASSKDGWFLTILDQADGFSETGLPKNFITLQIDPFNGTVRQYQP